jgi:hypothetical protein
MLIRPLPTHNYHKIATTTNLAFLPKYLLLSHREHQIKKRMPTTLSSATEGPAANVPGGPVAMEDKVLEGGAAVIQVSLCYDCDLR